MGRENGGGPELVSAESFKAMKQGMGCEDCQKQRLFLNSDKKSKARKSRKQKLQKVMSDSPVLIRLKGVLSNSDGYASSTSSGRGSVDSSSTSDSESSPRLQRHQYSSNKELSKLIRQWEKENGKRSNRSYRRNLANIPRLNNTRRLFRAEGPRLQYIWNNLHGDSSDNESHVSSFSSASVEDYWSDNETCDSKELEYRELHNLARWAAGPPLVRYSCRPTECLECQSLFYSGFPVVSHFPAQGQPCMWPECCPRESYRPPSRDSPDTVEDDDVASSESSGIDTLSTISVDSTEDDDAFVIDVTGLDVHISVEYLDENDPEFCIPYDDGWGGVVPYNKPYNTQYRVPYMTPVYTPVPYLPAAYAAPPFVPNAVAPLFGIPTWPAYVPWVLSGHEDSLDLPQKAYVPPSELEYYNASTPPVRPWICVDNPTKDQPAAGFTVMCYNVLCDKYCTRNLYGYCPTWALMWEYRSKGIITEIKNYGADIISLQEVETDVYTRFFEPELAKEGYEGIFSPKSRAKTMMREEDRKAVDGCAIFYRTSKFRLVKKELIEFNQIAIATGEGCDDMLNRVMTKDNIALIAMLELKDDCFNKIERPQNMPPQYVLVTTAHIHWDPEFCDVKLIQTMMLMTKLTSLVHEFQKEMGLPADPNSMPVILPCDLNSLPNSGVVEYLTRSRVAADHGDFKGLGYSKALQRLHGHAENKEQFTHPFNLRRTYNDSVMPYTNYTYDFKGIIDYIFVTEGMMKPLGILGPLDQEWLKEHKIVGCPHPHVPSDHFPLLVELELLVGKPKGSRR